MAWFGSLTSSPHAFALSLALALTVGSAVARAASPSEQEIEALVQRGNELRRSGDDQGALPLLEKAYALAPTPRTAVQLGLVEQALGRWAEADLHLTNGLKATKDPWIQRNRSIIEDALGRVKVNVARVEITGEPVGAEVLVGGRPVGKVPLGEPVRVSAGSVDVELRAPGYRSMLRTLTVAGGQYQPVVIRLERVAKDGTPLGAAGPHPPSAGELGATPSGTSGRVWATRGAWAGAALGLGLGTAFAISHHRQVEDFNDRNCVVTPGGMILRREQRGGGEVGVPDSDCVDRAARYDRTRTYEIVAFAVGGAFVATALVLHFTGRAGETEAPAAGTALRPRCAPDFITRGLVCGATF